MPLEGLPKQALLAKLKEKGRWDDYKYVGKTTLRILDRIAWDFNQAKCWRWWLNVMCGGSILSCCPHNPHGHERALKEEEEKKINKDVFFKLFGKKFVRCNSLKEN